MLMNLIQEATNAFTQTGGDPGVVAPAEMTSAAPGVWTLVERWPLAILGLPLLSFALCAYCAMTQVRNKLPAWITVASLGAAFGVTVMLFLRMNSGMIPNPSAVVGYEWINVSWGVREGQHLKANLGLYLDSLTIYWMLFVTGLGTLIALYASEYMAGDVGQGYCRFFAAFSLFVFSMAALVMADNLLLLYLGWEGVGLCSYLLIGYFYKKPSAVAAAKKAFIVNRIGDLGLALGVMLCFVQFGSLEYGAIFEKAGPYIEALRQGHLDQIPWSVQLIPILLMVGAFGKSAQLPLYVWLPDAMEGPTPVSALIHAATMVTAGVFLVARTYPLFLCSEYALPIVAWTGALTALLSATIGMSQFDIKRIMAYSTVSQLGYMFAGLGVLSSVGAAFHVLTHAFFKALLFLCCGAVMHGFGGQLDLRKLSGVMKIKGWGVVGVGMLVGCLNLAGFPFTGGFFSKDMILAEAFTTPTMQPIGWILLFTAGLTAYYTFRVFFRVFVGPVEYEPGDEVHGHADHGHGDHGHGDHGHDHGAPHGAPVVAHAAAAHEFHPHAPGWAINLVLGVLTACSIGSVGLYFVGHGHGGWAGAMVEKSSAAYESPYVAAHGAEGQAPHGDAGAEHAYAPASLVAVKDAHAGTFMGRNPHEVMYYVSGVVGFVGIAIAFVLHYLGRTTAAHSKADALVPALGPLASWARHKWYVDELYNYTIRVPLLVLAHIFHLIDKVLVDGLVNAAGWAPRGVGSAIRPSQSGVLHGYAVAMAGGICVLLVIVLLTMK